MVYSTMAIESHACALTGARCIGWVDEERDTGIVAVRSYQLKSISGAEVDCIPELSESAYATNESIRIPTRLYPTPVLPVPHQARTFCQDPSPECAVLENCPESVVGHCPTVSLKFIDH